MSIQVPFRIYKNGTLISETRGGVAYNCINVEDAARCIAQTLRDLAPIAGTGRIPSNLNEWNEIEVTFNGVTLRMHRDDILPQHD